MSDEHGRGAAVAEPDLGRPREVDTDPAPPRPGPTTDGRTRWAVPIVAALASAVAFLVARRTLIDDTFITLAYARNFAYHLHWGLIPQHTANSATSPLNVIVLGAALRILRNPTWAVGAVFVGSYAVFGWCLARVVRALRLSVGVAFVAIAVLLLNPLLLSVIGMEGTTLGLAVFGLLLWAAVEKRPVAFGIALGLTLVIRLDFVIVAATILVMTPAIRRAWLRWLVPAVVIAAPWYVLSWIALGSAIPDTLAIKDAQIWTDTFLSGPEFYARNDLGAVVVSFAPAVAGLAIVVWSLVRGLRPSSRIPPTLRPVVAFGASSVAYFVAYVVLAPPPYLWYYAPLIITTSVGGVLIAGFHVAHAGTSRPVRGRRAWAAAAVGAFAVAALVVIVANQRVGWTRPPIVGNLASPGDYERIGRDLHRRVGDAPIAVRSEIGALAYYCQCELLDAFSDRGMVIPLIENTIEGNGAIGRPLLEANYANLDRSLLPRPAEYVLDFAPDEPRGRDAWRTRSLETGDVEGFTLRRNPATGPVVAGLADELLAKLPSRPKQIVLHSDTGRDADVDVDLYESELAAEFRRRGIDANLHHEGATGTDVTVATGHGVGRALRHGRLRDFAYHGKVSLAERQRLARRTFVLEREKRLGRVDNLDFFYEMTEIGERIGRDVLVYVGDLRPERASAGDVTRSSRAPSPAGSG